MTKMDAIELHPSVVDAFGQPGHFVNPRGSRVIRATPLGTPVYFVINNKRDRIHGHQLKGVFYEQDVLQILAQHMPINGVFVDIGANIGNHALFMLRHGGARRVIPIEPNPDAIRLLAAMVRLNGLDDDVERATLGYGIGAENVGGYAIHNPKGNLGWVRLTQGDGEIELRTGDTLLANEARIDFIKIDVEGMEIEALSGLEGTIARHRPMMFIEVDTINRDAFFDAMKRFDYAIEHEFAQTKQNQNFLLRPN